jgi:CheY-like chemotaxis protein
MILIIEDQPLDAQLVALMLEQQGALPNGSPIDYEIVADGEAALRWLALQPPASVPLVITDRHLRHREDVLNVLARIKEAPALTAAAIVVMRSISDDQDSIQAAHQAGADIFVSKAARLQGAELLHLLSELWRADAAGQPRRWIERTS